MCSLHGSKFRPLVWGYQLFKRVQGSWLENEPFAGIVYSNHAPPARQKFEFSLQVLSQSWSVEGPKKDH